MLQRLNHFYVNGCFGEESQQPEWSLQIFRVRAACTSDGMKKRSKQMKINCGEPCVPGCLHVDMLVCVWMRVEGKALLTVCSSFMGSRAGQRRISIGCDSALSRCDFHN